jgi:hypothetical protein
LQELTQYCSVRLFSHIFSLVALAVVEAIAARSLSSRFARWNGRDWHRANDAA